MIKLPKPGKIFGILGFNLGKYKPKIQESKVLNPAARAWEIAAARSHSRCSGEWIHSLEAYNRTVIERVVALIERHKMLRFGRRIGVAVSGGADSVFLLRTMLEAGLAACVIHINHQLRGQESDTDEAFVRELAARNGLPVFAQKRAVPPGNVEQEARLARHAFYSSVISQGQCDAVATGHTADDQAETILYRFVRGSGTAGLAGILPVTNGRLIRPLLGVGREEIREWLRSRGASWREDCTNLDVGFARNRIRLRLMPEIVEYLNPSIVRTLCSMADWARAEEDYWQGELDRAEPQFLDQSGGAILFNLDEFNGLPVAVQRRLLRRAIERVAGDLRAIGFEHVEGIRRMTLTREGSGRIQLPGLDVYRSFDWLRLAPADFGRNTERNFAVPLAVPGLTTVPDRGITLKIELVRADAVYNNQMNALDADKCAGALELRNWRPGDRIQANTSGSTEKIKTLFQDSRVPLWERRNWPVIVQGNSILWTRHFGADRNAAAGPRTRTVLLIHETGESKHSFVASIKQKRAQGAATSPAGDQGAEVL